jgi:hypothetical protein
MMVGGIEGNSFPAPKPLIQKKQVIRRTGNLSAHGIADSSAVRLCFGCRQGQQQSARDLDW